MPQKIQNKTLILKSFRVFYFKIPDQSEKFFPGYPFHSENLLPEISTTGY